MTTAAQLTGATAAEVQAARIVLSSYLQTLYTTLSIQSGPLADLVLGPSSDALAAVEHRGAQITVALNPYTALASGGYDPTTLNAALAGLGVTRLPATTATGSIALLFTTSATQVVPSGTLFQTADGTQFKTTTQVRFRAPGSTNLTTGDVLLVVNPVGGFIGVVNAAAVVAAALGNRAAGTPMTLVSSTALNGFTAAYAATNFTGGADAESDAALLARLPAATAARTAASDAGATALVTAAGGVGAVSLLGFGDALMLRGRSVLSSQAPGYLDVLVRGNAQAGLVGVPVTATLVNTSGPYGVWQFTLGAQAAPGWFLIQSVLPAGSALTATGYTPSSVVLGFDTSWDPSAPYVQTPADAAISAYSTAVVQFADPNTPTGGLIVGVSTKTYTAVIRTVPGVLAGQQAVEAAGAQAAGGDCLVRGALPVMTAVTATATPAVGTTLTAAQVSTAVSSAVNKTGINSVLTGSVVASSALALLPAGTSLALSNWTGTSYGVDGSAVFVSGTDGISIAQNLTRGVGPTTVAYYMDPASVTVVLA